LNGAGPSGLTRRVIPCLDVAAGRVVKGVRFAQLEDQGDPAQAAERYAEQGADEIVFLDITAAPEAREADAAWVRRTAERVFIPLTVGGGVRRAADADRLLRAGADKVAVNTAAVERPTLVGELARRLGSQCVVLSIDARRRALVEGSARGRAPGLARSPGPERGEKGGGSAGIGTEARERVEAGGTSNWEVIIQGGRKATGLDALAWIAEAVERGAGEVLLTSIDHDGTRAGYDLDLIGAVASAVPVPVIASGGAGTPEHLAAALAAGAAAVLAASIFHRGTYTVGEIKRALAEAGFAMREETA
jgi:cyclase